MTIPLKYSNHYVPVKYFLASCRALSDGRSGIMQLEKKLNSAKVLLSDWKVQWIGTCTISRTAIDLFRIDAKSCLNLRIREEIAAEWSAIKDNKEMHAIFWEFLRDERNNVIHQYQWRTYEAWMKPDGTFRENRLSLLSIEDDGARPILMMNDGPFKGQNSLDLLNESAGWVEERFFRLSGGRVLIRTRHVIWATSCHCQRYQAVSWAVRKATSHESPPVCRPRCISQYKLKPISVGLLTNLVGLVIGLATSPCHVGGK